MSPQNSVESPLPGVAAARGEKGLWGLGWGRSPEGLPSDRPRRYLLLIDHAPDMRSIGDANLGAPHWIRLIRAGMPRP
ncbi:hypothetical protein H6G52_06735 [Limnothrix sp. FACHB-881]|uniref:hypothetical protein n=1 Tax=Limnothrix sp. FACHB-881 TaxID=2692819 RepID=UPI0016873376|nr:hypothetical protein [Limnothrix sp. FACHB-881]MBD2635051.1 hypothetical protein [Limnothrix sp. FACHB-881]